MEQVTPMQVIARFGGTQASAARALGISRAAICKWVKRGKVPEVWLYKLPPAIKGTQ